MAGIGIGIGLWSLGVEELGLMSFTVRVEKP